MMQKPTAGLCKQHAALPQWMCWRRLCFRKLESLQGSSCYLRTVHIIASGSRMARKCVTCSVSVAKKLTCTLPDRNSCCHRPLCKVCTWKTVFYVCLHVSARFLFFFSSSHGIISEEPSAFWLLVGDLLQGVSSF